VKTRYPRVQHAARTAEIVRTMKYAEKKNKDTTLGPFAGTLAADQGAVAAPWCLCVVAQGATANERIGRRIHAKSLFIRGRVLLPVTMTGAAGFRLVVFQDRTPNGALPTLGSVFEEDHILSPLNLGNSKRFKVLADEIGPSSELMSVDTYEGFTFERYLKLNTEIGYVVGAGAGTYADVLTNGIYAVVFAGGANCGANAPSVEIRCRLRYVDL